jgi:beta-galactosidase
MDDHRHEPHKMSRRDFVRGCAAGATALATDSLLLGPRETWAHETGAKTPPPRRTVSLQQNWLFGGKMRDRHALEPGFREAGFSKIDLPHCVVELSWQKWDPATWEDVWTYRRHFSLPDEMKQGRIFLQFDGVMVGATPVINGHALPRHLGGYLPFQYEITHFQAARDNVLAVEVDSRWQNVPPEGSPFGPQSIDYMEPGGIIRPVRLLSVPQVFIADVFAKPVKVLDPQRRIEVTCSIDAAVPPDRPMRLEAALEDGSRVLARASQDIRIEKAGQTDVVLTISDLGNVKFWEIETPQLYGLKVTLLAGEEPLDQSRARMGLRDAQFEADGFFLNGRRTRIFGLDRHELFPYVGFAMPARAHRHDAEILRHDFNCNFVRCSHYPQSEAFLDACDELGLMVWEELPGWQYLGDQTWQDLAVRDVQEMVRRDRNHPAVVIWGVRINESANNPALYRRTKEAAKALDDSRPTSGTMTRLSTRDWDQDVFAFDDYHAAPDGSVAIASPLPGVPYFVTEAVGQFNYSNRKNFDAKYRRAGDVELQSQQAVRHAQAHDRGAAHPRCGGVIAWCAFDYGSLINSYQGVKCPGVSDIFRVPKLGAAFYRAQVDPKQRPVIEPGFYWDFGPQSPSGPGNDAAIFSNCDRLELFVAGQHHGTVHPEGENYPRLEYPPFFADLAVDGAGKPELRIEGYVGGRQVLTRSFSSDASKDQLLFAADSDELVADGTDAVRLEFKVADRYGAIRPFADGPLSFQVKGPGTLVGDNPFQLGDNGGAGAVWLRSVAGRAGTIKVLATHPRFGVKTVEVRASA